MVCRMATPDVVPMYDENLITSKPGLQYPYESYLYTQLQDSLRTLTHAITNEVYAVQGVEDYAQKFQLDPLEYGSVYNMKLEALRKAQLNLSEAYTNAQQNYVNYKNEATECLSRPNIIY